MKKENIDTDELRVGSRLWELYSLECKDRGVTATMKDYLIWLDDNDYDIQGDSI